MRALDLPGFYPPGGLQWRSTCGGRFCSPEGVINGFCGLALLRLRGSLWAVSKVESSALGWASPSEGYPSGKLQ